MELIGISFKGFHVLKDLQESLLILFYCHFLVSFCQQMRNIRADQPENLADTLGFKFRANDNDVIIHYIEETVSTQLNFPAKNFIARFSRRREPS